MSDGMKIDMAIWKDEKGWWQAHLRINEIAVMRYTGPSQSQAIDNCVHELFGVKHERNLIPKQPPRDGILFKTFEL
jgi:hypothetical protein